VTPSVSPLGAASPHRVDTRRDPSERMNGTAQRMRRSESFRLALRLDPSRHSSPRPAGSRRQDMGPQRTPGRPQLPWAALTEPLNATQRGPTRPNAAQRGKTRQNAAKRGKTRQNAAKRGQAFRTCACAL